MASMRKHKWQKYKVMKKSEQLAPHMPKTRMMTRHYFSRLINKYNRVILKPVGGSRGAGVFKVSSKGNDWYSIHHEDNKRMIHGEEQAYEYVKRNTGSRSYIIQRHISLATVDSRPFDMRIIVQRKKNSRTWKVTGRVGKVAGKGYIVTNITRSRGTVLPIEAAIKRSSLEEYHSVNHLVSKIDSVAIHAAKRLRKYFPYHRIYGLDIGLDEEGHIWIIEANLYPAMSHFQKLKDANMYRRIKRYKKG